MKVWIDDGLREAGDERISVSDHGLLYGDGIFEGIRIYARQVFRLDAHLERLALGARAVGIELPGGVERMRQIVLDTARALDRDQAYVRLVVTSGEAPLGIERGARVCEHQGHPDDRDDAREHRDRDQLQSEVHVPTRPWSDTEPHSLYRIGRGGR